MPPVEVFLEVTCWYGFMKKVCPSDVIFTFGTESDLAFFFLAMNPMHSLQFLPPLNPCVGFTAPLTLALKVSPLLPPGGRERSIVPLPCAFFLFP